MIVGFQDAIFAALVDEVVWVNNRSNLGLRILKRSSYSNAGTLYVVTSEEWSEVVRITYDFQRDRATLVIDHDPNTPLMGPASEVVFHLDPSRGEETKRLLAAWRARLALCLQEAL